MTLARLTRVTLIDSLVNQLETRIVGGEYAPGDRLAGEDELATQFGVSRPVVREGLSRLRERGYLETIKGRGTFVKHPGDDDLAASILRQLQTRGQDGFTVDNLFEARESLEVVTARLAAGRATEDDVRTLRGHLDTMVANTNDPVRFAQADVSFHAAITAAAHNPFLAAVIQPILGLIAEGVSSNALLPESVSDGLRMHAELVMHIEAHDAGAAAVAMRAHLADSRKYFPDSVVTKLRL